VTILTEIVASALDAAAAEMCASLIRTAYSPNVKERADCSTALCDLRGRTLALATHAPMHLGSTLRLVDAILARFPEDGLRDGDVFFANDPFIVGVTHLNDCTAAAPVFVDGRPVAFAVAVAHHSDVGGRVPGSESGDSTSIFQEGLRVPPVRLVEAGRRRNDLWELFLLNSRTPAFSEGDLRAQTAALDRGARRLRELYRRHGTAATGAAIEAMLDATERRARSRIGAVLRPGTYTAEDWLDDDGATGRPLRLSVTVSVAPDRIDFDFAGSDGQIASGKNVPLTHTMATVYYCAKAILDPALPINEGLYRTVRVSAPEGSVLNPRPPAGVSSRGLTSMILADVLLEALGQAAPDRATACGGPFQGIILSGWDRRRERFFVDYENFAGGHGASRDADGMDATQLHMTNTSNLPIEAMEIEFPVRVERYELAEGSGGAGRRQGGRGVRRELRILDDGIHLACRSARQRFAARGLAGGGPGGLGAFTVRRADGSEHAVPGTVSDRPLARGDLVRIVTPGGGGFGPAAPDREN